MKLALLMGNRYNPWHLRGFKLLRGTPELTAFRADSQIQDHFDERGGGMDGFAVERIYFDTQAGNPVTRAINTARERYFNRNPRLLPFHDRLNSYDVLHSWELFTDWSDEALRAHEAFRIPFVVTVWDLLPFNMEREAGRREIKQRVAAGADRFIVYTDRSHDMLSFENVNAKQIVKIDPGVDLEMFAPGTADRAALGLSNDDFVILFVGWFVPRKGVDFLLYAVRRLIDAMGSKGPRLRVVLVGSGFGRERVEALVGRLGLTDTCVFTGAMTYDKMPNVFRACDVFVLPSVASDEWQEQFGMSLIEAMACGKPCVASLSGAIEEIAGESCLLVQPNDFVAIERALGRLVTKPELRSELGKSSRARTEQRFDVRKHAEALSDVYASLTHV